MRKQGLIFPRDESTLADGLGSGVKDLGFRVSRFSFLL